MLAKESVEDDRVPVEDPASDESASDSVAGSTSASAADSAANSASRYRGWFAVVQIANSLPLPSGADVEAEREVGLTSSVRLAHVVDNNCEDAITRLNCLVKAS